MRQFEVFRNPSKGSRDFAPYLVVLQSHHLSRLETVVVAPLVRDATRVLTELDVTLQVEGEDLVLAIPELGSVERAALHARAGSVADQEDAIRRALERLLTGF